MTHYAAAPGSSSKQIFPVQLAHPGQGPYQVVPPALDGMGDGTLASVPLPPRDQEVTHNQFRDGLRMITKSADRHDIRAAALKFAIATYRREPEIVKLASVRPQLYRLKVFEKQRPIKAYLRTCKSRDYVSGQATEDLLKDAQFHVEEGEKLSVAGLYERRLDSISQLKQRDQNMHRAIFMLAYLKGNAKVIASLRYLGIIMRIEFNDAVHPAGIKDSLKRLVARNLIEFDYAGKRSPGHTKSNTISVAYDLEFVEDEAPEYIVKLLTMSPETVDALSDYVSKRSEAVRVS